MNKQKYREYLKSDHWKNFRIEYYKANERKCIECGSTNDLNLHHLTYERLGREKLEDVVCLCNTCHFKLHEKMDKKKKPIAKKRKTKGKTKSKPKRKVSCTNCKWFKFGYYCDKFDKSAPYGRMTICNKYTKKHPSTRC